MNHRNFAVYQGPGTNMLAQINTRFDQPEYNRRDKTFDIQKNGFLVRFAYLHTEGNEHLYKNGDIPVFDKDRFGIGPSFQKLLDLLIIQLAEENSYRSTGENNLNVILALDKYLELCGYSQPTKSIRDEVRKTIRKDLNTLRCISIEWTERKKRKKHSEEVFYSMFVCESAEIKRGMIRVNFTEDFVDYLVNAYVTWLPAGLFVLDNRSNAYYLGRKLALHYNMDSNVRAGSNNCLSIATMVKACPGIMDAENLRRQNVEHWERRLKLRLESALDRLVETGILNSWNYCNRGKTPVKNLEVALKNRDLYTKLFVQFEFNNTLDQSIRRQKKEEIAERALQNQRKTNSPG